MSSLNPKLNYYSPPDKKNWNQRVSKNVNQPLFWHEKIKLSHKKLIRDNSNYRKCVGILGYVCDEGVRRNSGRVGAVNGPKEIRKQLGKLAFHLKTKLIIDFGDVTCPNKEMEGCQKAFSEISKELIRKNCFTIGLGGGHDLSYGHFMGIKKAFSNKKIGIINFDAHFDLRKPSDKGNSGTPFYQILNKWEKSVKYLVLGIQKSANSRILYNTASKLGVSYIPVEDFNFQNEKKVLSIIESFIKTCDLLYVSVDLDGFTSSIAPGVSAPSPFGFSISFFKSIFEHIFKSKKVIAMDIVELNPKYDYDSSTAKLSAQIIDLACKINPA
ncbi:MAG: formimidoylglutamase [Flavobacteriaceae bacterium]|nr:formimidoylglutamase [Flavobacteriaceae bacterium]|tara:strand:+ start:41704 stop:42684 length:981 start_codon:yes stop_codon:yes gene_type:complete